MEPLDHDMDDLLRKAAADYPLKPGVSDWDKLAIKLQQTTVVPEVAKKKKSRYFFLVLLMLLLCLVIGGIFYYDGSRNEIASRTNLNDLRKDSLVVKAPEKRSYSVTKLEKVATLDSIVGTPQTIVSSNRKLPASTKKYHDFIKSSSKTIYVASSHREDDVETAVDISVSSVKGLPLSLRYSIPEPELKYTPIKLPKISSQHQHGFYFGLNGGPEWSKVGSQTITRAGYHGGILLGYRLNTTFSLESGVMLGKKRYYSAGKYFSMSKIAAFMPAGMEIINIDGQSAQLEIPVSLKYDFLRRKQSGLFFSAGVISYVYLHEKNYYQTMLNGVRDNQMGMYKEDHFSLAAEIQISGGYEHSLGKSLRFRIEPYKKIPMRKSGMGSMPVFSSGVNVAFIRPFK